MREARGGAAVTFRRLLLVLTLLSIFTMAMRVSMGSDTWWHLRAGEWMAEHRQILREDPFSLTRAGQPWIYPGWLAELILYGVFRLGGFAGLNLLTALMVLAGLGCLWPILEGPPLLKAFTLLLAAMASGVYWAARPHIFSFALTGIFLLILEGVRNGQRKALWALPALMVLWVNLHGGFAIGFLLLGAYLAGEAISWLAPRMLRVATSLETRQRRRATVLALSAASAGCVAAVCINPNGPSMLAYPFKTLSIGVLQDYIVEWQSPNFHNLEVQPFLWMLCLLIVAMAYSSKRPSLTELILVIGFSAMSFMAGRHIATFALAASPVLARHAHASLAPLLERRKKGKELRPRLAKALNLAILCVLAAAALLKVHLPLSEAFNEEEIRSRVPAEAVAYIAAHNPAGPIFNSYNWGGYIIWELFPAYRSFVDGRTDLFGDEILKQYLQVWQVEEGFAEVLEAWDIRLVLVEPNAPLARVLPLQGWRTLYADEKAVVLAREEP
jgi:hypothetical protein